MMREEMNGKRLTADEIDARPDAAKRFCSDGGVLFFVLFVFFLFGLFIG
jgi:hypothetical protein